MELMKTKRLARSSATPGKLVGSIEPANWFSSLRTLHECALCPDIELYMSSWERLEDSCGNPHPPSSPHVSQFREPPNVDQSESRLQYSLVFGRDTRCQGQRAEFGVSNRSRGYIRPIQPDSPRQSPNTCFSHSSSGASIGRRQGSQGIQYILPNTCHRRHAGNTQVKRLRVLVLWPCMRTRVMSTACCSSIYPFQCVRNSTDQNWHVCNERYPSAAYEKSALADDVNAPTSTQAPVA